VLGSRPVLSLNRHSNPNAPGQLDRHYAPDVPVYLTDNVEDTYRELFKMGILPALLSFKNPYPGLNFSERIILSAGGNIEEACHKLFAALRDIDKIKPEAVIAERFPEYGLGRAINDRLTRAAATL
jgi:L-threonylcarbamoyladenylate synthase